MNLRPDKEIGILEFECTLPVPQGKLHHLQRKDEMHQKRARQVHMGTDSSKSYIDKDDILRRLLEDNEEIFQTTVLPKYLSILYYSWLTIQQGTMGSNGSTCQFDGCTIGTI